MLRYQVYVILAHCLQDFPALSLSAKYLSLTPLPTWVGKSHHPAKKNPLYREEGCDCSTGNTQGLLLGGKIPKSGLKRLTHAVAHPREGSQCLPRTGLHCFPCSSQLLQLPCTSSGSPTPILKPPPTGRKAESPVPVMWFVLRRTRYWPFLCYFNFIFILIFCKTPLGIQKSPLPAREKPAFIFLFLIGHLSLRQVSPCADGHGKAASGGAGRVGRGRAGAGALPARWHIPLSPLSRDFDILLQSDLPRTPQLGQGMRVTAALGVSALWSQKAIFWDFFFFSLGVTGERTLKTTFIWKKLIFPPQRKDKTPFMGLRRWQ